MALKLRQRLYALVAYEYKNSNAKTLKVLRAMNALRHDERMNTTDLT